MFGVMLTIHHLEKYMINTCQAFAHDGSISSRLSQSHCNISVITVYNM